MNDRERAFRRELISTFRGEAADRFRRIATGLVALEKETQAATRKALLEEIFREVHSLKGAARAVNLPGIESVSQALEGVFAGLKKKKIQENAELFDLLHQALDFLETHLKTLDPEGEPAEPLPATPLIQRLEAAKAGRVPAPVPPIREAEKPAVAPPEDKGPGGSPSPHEPHRAGIFPGVVPSPDREGGSPAKKGQASPPRPTAAPAPKPSVGAREEQPVAQPAAPEAGSSKRENVGPAGPPVPPALPRLSVPSTVDAGKAETPAESVRVAVPRLNALLIEAEELLSVRLSFAHLVAEIRCLTAQLAGFRNGEKGAALSLAEARKALAGTGSEGGRKAASALFQAIERHQDFFKTLEGRVTDLCRLADQERRGAEKLIEGLRENVRNVLMIPCSALLGIFPKMVRDLAREARKEVDLVLEGGEVEIDRRILEEMKDPLIHLIRNAVDHGIEFPQVRAECGKTSGGRLSVRVIAREGGKLEIVVEDDGGGIATEQVRASARKLGLMPPGQLDGLGEAEASLLVFQSGVSTSPIITSLSGRGLGLAIVRERVERLGGTVTLDSQPGRGTAFRILLARSLASFRGVVCRSGGHRFFLPVKDIDRCLRVNPAEIRTVENRETIEVGGKILPIAHLARVLDLPDPARRGPDPATVHALILTTSGKKVVFLVDEILSDQEVREKDLGKQIQKLRHVSGSTILGSGEVIPILDVPELVWSAIRQGGAPRRANRQAEDDPMARRRKKILIVEDSITSRTLLKNLFESAGYESLTAVDGVEGFLKLKTDEPDLVVSDVEMPRMNGFDLALKIRAEKKFAEIPIVLVTALESREDQERGIEAGANAYLLKSRLDQGNLLEVVRRLL